VVRPGALGQVAPLGWVVRVHMTSDARYTLEPVFIDRVSARFRDNWLFV
jgi:hypothetical protein